MNDTDLGEIVTPRISSRLSRLARKYKVGGSTGDQKVEKTMHEWKQGQLHSGSKKGPKVTSRKQAIAIALSQKRRALAGKYRVGGKIRKGEGWWDKLQDEVREHRALEQLKHHGSSSNQRNPL